MLRRLILISSLALSAPLSASAQDQTLADIRQDLSVLYVEVQRLTRELSTTGAPSVDVGGGSVLDRVSAMESELQRLTSKTEELEFRINRITRDGTNRIGDLEFRLCELEVGCDIGLLGDTPTLGGVDAAENLPEPEAATEQGPALAVGEQAEFDAARTAFEEGDFERATELFLAHTETYPGGPLAPDAHYLRGEAYDSLGEISNAARAYLASFSGAPTGARAPDALFKLGASLGALGQMQEACTTLQEVGNRFPASEAAGDAAQARVQYGCP
ncbi:tol-pal system protein YbgF [Roseisalinus antarcticus]|uniref:Cell division coordinator CpoB n=1 Tax=Roseisalinus antarcticus TaxID=254357 RepID=A0A1Y5SYG2_9RHOB|nr:tol-pal system protein YbgF [Roseisalinus antarcticus]SLN50930.1 tol-pal system protein YbgF [Roseisalinus antarcticus]